MKFSVQELTEMSIADLTNLNQLVIGVIKAKRGLIGTQKAQNLTLKQEVKIDHKDHNGSIFVIDKINKTKAVCTLKGTSKSYNVPFSMIITEIDAHV